MSGKRKDRKSQARLVCQIVRYALRITKRSKKLFQWKSFTTWLLFWRNFTRLRNDGKPRVENWLYSRKDSGNGQKKLEQITSSASSLEKKFDKLDTWVLQLEAKQSKTGSKVKELEDGLTELNKQVNELNAANEEIKANCEKTSKAL